MHLVRDRSFAPCMLSIAAVVTACAPATGIDSLGPGEAGGAGAGSTGSDGSSFAVGGGGPGAGGASSQLAEVFGHSDSTLYRMDPTTKAVTVVGAFQGCSAVVDIAVDADSRLFATSETGLHRVDPATAACTPIAQGDYPNSLSFVPAGTVDPAVEALVGYVGSTYVRIDPSTGAVTDIGAIADGYESSGDIVSVEGGKTLLTVTGNGCEDCLVEVDPTSGDLVKSYGPIGYGAVYGLAFWAGSAYGFSEAGDLFEVTFDGDAIATTPIPIPDPPLDLRFWGAGSTTSAPPLADPK